MRVTVDSDKCQGHNRCKALASLGVTVTQRVAGTAVSRWVPLAGAAAVGGYAYWDTLQVAKTARRLLEATPEAFASAVPGDEAPARDG